MAISIDLKDAERWVGTIHEKMQGAARAGILSAAERAKTEIQTKIIPSRSPQPVDRSMYRSGWQVEKTADGADIYNAEPHAQFIEYGVRASNVRVGAAMILALAEWAVRKGITTPDQAKGVAWAIARKMQRRGIFNGGTGFRIMEEAVRLLPKWLDQEIRREMNKIK